MLLLMLTLDIFFSLIIFATLFHAAATYMPPIIDGYAATPHFADIADDAAAAALR